MVIFYILMLFIIIAALVAIETKDLLSAVISIGAVGFGASIMFLFLRAPDIAITQIVVEVLGLVILIRVCLSHKARFVSDNAGIFGAVVVGAILLAGAFVVPYTLLDFGTPVFAETPQAASQTYVAEGLDDTGAANIVSAVILDYRAYDTLGEATVLFTSIIGATVILRKKSKKLLEEPE